MLEGGHLGEVRVMHAGYKVTPHHYPKLQGIIRIWALQREPDRII